MQRSEEGKTSSSAVILPDTTPDTPPDNAKPSDATGVDSRVAMIEENLTDLEDAETPADDPFMFRQMGSKVKAKFKKFRTTVLSPRTTEIALEELPVVRFVDSDTALWSAFRVPMYRLARDDEDKKGVPVILALIKDIPSKRYSPNMLYQIDLRYGELKWTIYRRVYDFFRLHSVFMFRHLQGHVTGTIPAFPSQLSYIVDASAIKAMIRDRPAETWTNAARERGKALEAYLANLIASLSLQVHTTELLEFLELSMLTLTLISRDENRKLKEGYLKNRIFDTKRAPSWWSCFETCIPKRTKYRTKWFIVRSSYIAFVESVDQKMPSDVLLCDKNFHIIVENENTHHVLRPLTVTIVNSAKKLQVRPESNSQMSFWLEAFHRLSLDCVWCHPHRFGSFAPVRSNCRMDWLIDAEQYYTELVRAIQSAKEEIYLHGWWISPELYLVRPASAHPHMRLDRLLQRKAREGVKIYIIVFKEFSMALSLNSYHTKSSLEKLHPNIRVQRHPDHLGGILYWAHHEKIAIIDQRIAFSGGLDLCFGRYDAQAHSLTDYHPDDPGRQIWSGLDYSNPRIRDFRNVTRHATALVDRKKIPRMPWHDVQAVVYGAPARDTARHFIERWNFVKQQKAMHKELHIPFLLPKADFSPEESERQGLTGTTKVQVLRSVSEWSMGTAPENGVYDAYMYYIENARHFIYIENQFFVSRSSELQTAPIKNRIAQALVERIIRAHSENEPFRVIVFLPLLPAFEAEVNRAEASVLRIVMQGQYSGISRGPYSIMGQLASHGIKADQYISFYSLRKYDYLEGEAVTEQLYIHTKLLIVDDQVAIMGSCNINDRSMLGTRDSEVCIVVEDECQVEATLNGKSVTVGKKVRELRIRLLQEHLGLLHLHTTDARVRALEDPTSEHVFVEVLRKQASRNTQIYRELFHCVPDDCVDTWEEYRRFTETPRTHVFNDELGINSLEMLTAIQGNIVLFPMQFLKNEDLAASVLTPEFLLPIEVYM